MNNQLSRETNEFGKQILNINLHQYKADQYICQTCGALVYITEGNQHIKWHLELEERLRGK